MSDSLGTLLRLERHALDEEKRALQEITAALGRHEARAGRLRQERERELAGPLDGPAEAGVLARFLAESRRREQAISAAIEELEAKRSERTLGLQRRCIELKRLELLIARRASCARTTEERRAQRELDDLVLIRRAHEEHP